MKICSFNLQCDNFNYTFAPLENEKLYKLHKENEMLSSYFTIPGSQKNALKISMSKTAYEKEVLQLQNSLFIQYLFILAAVAALSFIFALYTLAPLRNALKLTEEFVKDILHLQTLLQERINLFQTTYPSIHFHGSVGSIMLHTHKDSVTSVVDNLLSNAAKYNKQYGAVFISLDQNLLHFKDTGKWIKNPQKVFERFYKEQERGIGIGLHIAKKLCDELGIAISLQSTPNEGSIFKLDLGKLL